VSDKILSQLKGGAQGLVHVAEDIETKEKYVLKAILMDE
jgi:hypothetical protein